MQMPSRRGLTTSASCVACGIAMTKRVLCSDFQNRRATATFTSSSQGNPFRTLPKGKPGAYMRGIIHAKILGQNPRHAINGSKVRRSNPVPRPWVVGAAAVTVGAVPKWEAA